MTNNLASAVYVPCTRHKFALSGYSASDYLSPFLPYSGSYLSIRCSAILGHILLSGVL
jgi:hypothetical protein